MEPTMRAMMTFALGVLLTAGAAAAPCEKPDPVSRVTGDRECLVVRTYPEPAPATAKVLLVVLHGDVSSGGPANYHFALAQKLATDGVVTVAMIRPGYADGAGGESSGSHNGRNDHYTKENALEVAGAVARLKAHYQAGKVILVGHSGGAATAALVLGLQPALATGAVLVACPCELVSWRSGRRAWTRSENPLDWAGKVSPAVRVIALTGARDDNTSPMLAQTYINALAGRGVNAVFETVPDAGHNDAFRSPLVGVAVDKLLKD